MANKSSKLTILEYRPNQGAVEILEEMLQKAKAGKIVSVTAFCENNGGTVVTFSGGDVTFCDVLAAFELWKYRCCRDKCDD